MVLVGCSQLTLSTDFFDNLNALASKQNVVPFGHSKWVYVKLIFQTLKYLSLKTKVKIQKS